MKPFKLIVGLLIFSLLLSAAFFVFLLRKETQHRLLPVVGQVGEFVLTDSQGREFGSQQLKGQIWIADFIFTTCSGICPIMSKNMSQLHRSFLIVDGITLVSISVNPEQDTPMALNEYAKKYKAEPSRWRFLTGSRDTIQDLAVNHFRLGSVDEPVLHSGRFVLVDRYGRIRGYYEGTDEKEMQLLFKDAAQLLKERE